MEREDKKIEIGKPYQYKELCEVLSEDYISGGNQRASQIKRWSLKYDLVKVPGTKSYVVNEIYSVPLKQDELRGRKSEYAKAIGYVLFMLCYNNTKNENNHKEVEYRKKHPRVDGANELESDFYEFTASKSQLYVLLGLCKDAFINQVYNKNMQKFERIAAYPNLFQIFQDEVFGQCKNILESARKTMKSRMLLNSHETIEFAYDTGDDIWDWRVATIEEENHLINSKRRALSECGCVIEADIYRKGIEDKYRAKVIEFLEEEHGIKIVSYRNSITFWAAKSVVNDFVGRVMAGREGDILKIKSDIINAAMVENNEAFIKWLDNRTEYDWYTLNNGFQSKRKEGKAVSSFEWKKWDDILIELYQGDEEEARLHRLFSNPNDEKDFYFGGEKHNEYMALREIMKSKYIELGPPPSQSGSKK